MIGDPSMQPLGSKPAMIHAIRLTPSHADNATTFDANIDSTAERTEQAGRWNPALRLVSCIFIDTTRPLFMVGRPRTPYVGDTVARLSHRVPPESKQSAQLIVLDSVLSFRES